MALGITDLMNVFGGLRFYTHALSAGLKPILGCDVKIKNNKFPDNPYRMTFYCMNHTGYHSLCVLLTKAFLEGQDPYRGQICDDWLDVPGATDGLIALTAAPRDACRSSLTRVASVRRAALSDAGRSSFRTVSTSNSSVPTDRRTKIRMPSS